VNAGTFLDRLDAALVSGAAKLWSELLQALALAGQSAAGVRCFPPDPPDADERSVGLDRSFLQKGMRAASRDWPADVSTHAIADPGCVMDGAAAIGTRACSRK